MADVNYGVALILCHGGGAAEAGSVLADEVSCGGVLVF